MEKIGLNWFKNITLKRYSIDDTFDTKLSKYIKLK